MPRQEGCQWRSGDSGSAQEAPYNTASRQIAEGFSWSKHLQGVSHVAQWSRTTGSLHNEIDTFLFFLEMNEANRDIKGVQAMTESRVAKCVYLKDRIRSGAQVSAPTPQAHNVIFC